MGRQVSRRHQEINGYPVYLVRSAPHTYWVRLAASGRTLGSVFKDRSAWCWATTRNAYRGDGRPESARDGLGEPVPAHLDGIGRVTTQMAACEALVAHLAARQAPALGFGPHPEVRSVSHV